MEKRQLGRSDLFVSKMGLGCMSLGKEEAHARSIIDEAVELGINYFDTADLYDFGLNEEFVGKALQNRRQDFIIATKAGNRWEEGKEGWTWDPSKAHIQKAVKDSLLRLGTDYIDLYQLHGGTIDDNIDETIEAFEELKKEGLIREYGISSIRPNVIKQYLEKSSIVSIMMQYSLTDRRPEEWFPLIEEHGVSVIARGPLAKGILSERELDHAGSSIKEKGYMSYSFEELGELREEMKKAAPRHSYTEAALQYCLAAPAVAAVIPGASKLAQLQQNTSAVNAEPLTKEEIEFLRKISKADRYEQHRE
ncbi:aldo/keto reductase [Bacillus sp. FJAT-42376]|uniref:aldo/keto reductase n=1 Tax=Bacillus sp. FJAT-42376 TaxID=2014076 RepID=UPI000F4DC1F7|nr:aldo/keto reductase [Bacillus sp. FJAT-42376]AZB43424.1 aldo/keto reductase [Bacillus sp. FJAT-42376]